MNLPVISTHTRIYGRKPDEPHVTAYLDSGGKTYKAMGFTSLEAARNLIASLPPGVVYDDTRVWDVSASYDHYSNY